MNRIVRRRFQDEISRRLEEIRTGKSRDKRTQKDIAAALTIDATRLSRFKNGDLAALTPEQIASLARELGIDVERLTAVDDETVDRFTVAICPRAECYLATLVADGMNLCITPFCHTPPVAYCPFCPEQPLRRTCANKDCQSAIRIGARNCPDCGEPYVETPDEYKIRDRIQLASFVVQTMAMRREIVGAFIAQNRIKPDKSL